MKRLIVTSDDFGAAVAVNEAVEQAHRGGILTAASLMVSGDAAADAVARARTMPRLGVGLHVVLVEGRPTLPPEQVSELLDTTGHFRADMVRAGITIFTNPAARRQLLAEVEAQFAAFAATGLPLDHVNAHKHFHLHPTIASAILRVGKRYRMKSVRAPIEPRAVLARIEPGTGGVDVARLWALLVRRRMRAAGMTVPDQVFGLAWSGAMDASRIRGLIEQLPDGLTEIYTHPATDDRYPSHAPGYAYRAELAGLIDPLAREAISRDRIALGSFTDFA
ncbi:MAG: hopanoid biosynthesis-associated protein HpnK [Pseudomonadota bacterium]|uniref:hopanoid biosynthesis-associated protein HpnK n=1 Tax=Sphingomonas sp. ERG5 TaxID=1381597 RepID=UPI00054B5220|nr:hopanoid biosynthesis-associated protein HpnK [Sphingomonas sp. ERG5]